MDSELIIKILVCFLAGTGAGLGTGFAGMSAAAVIGPMLVGFLDVPAYQAVGIGLISDVIASAASAATYQRHKNLNIKKALPLMISVLLMTVVGSLVSSLLPNATMGNAMIIAMFLLGLRFILRPITDVKTSAVERSPRRQLALSLGGGAVVGFVYGFIGAGGGMMMLFFLTGILGYEMHKAVGTSVFIMTFTALTGGVSHVVIGGMPDVTCLVLCVVFTFLWSVIASWIANRAKARTLNRIVGTVLLVFGAAIFVLDLFASAA